MKPLHRITNTVRPFSPAMAALAESGRAIMQAEHTYSDSGLAAIAKPLIECANAIKQADLVNETARTELAEAQSTLYRIKAVRMASALGKPELADEILQALHAHDDCEVGFLVRTS